MTPDARPDAATPDARWQALRDRLESQRRAVCDELRAYPPQVAGCDLHYKDLAERRAALSAELARLDRARAAGEAVDAFLGASPLADPPVADIPTAAMSPAAKSAGASHD